MSKSKYLREATEEIRKVTGVSISAINIIVRNYRKRETLEGNYCELTNVSSMKK